MIDKTKMKAFVEVLIPGTQCNIKCHYCYLVQQNRRKMQKGVFNYDLETMIKAFAPERWGGVLYISLCGEGETLLWKELPEFTLALLKQGHYINITNNGTITKAFERFYEIIPQELLHHLNFSFSYHPLELERIKRKDVFFDNVCSAKRHGCSILVQFNLSDGYLPILDDIERECVERVGAKPQVAATRQLTKDHKWKLYTEGTMTEYKEVGERFDSPLFDFTMKNFNVKRREFCYAGLYTYTLSLSNGHLTPCYSEPQYQNIFENVKSPISLRPVGCTCKDPYCINSSHFISLGCIPSYKSPSYASLRNRVCTDGTEWYTPEFKSFVSQKLYANNPLLSQTQRILINIQNTLCYSIYRFKSIMFRILLQCTKRQ